MRDGSKIGTASIANTYVVLEIRYDVQAKGFQWFAELDLGTKTTDSNYSPQQPDIKPPSRFIAERSCDMVSGNFILNNAYAICAIVLWPLTIIQRDPESAVAFCSF